MRVLSSEQFADFFRALHGRPPYSWQTRLAACATEGDWPGAIDLPTGSGKTACIDVAVFALACQASRILSERTAPRRIFFCVNRRVIVDEAYQRSERIARRLWEAERNPASNSPVLCNVAAALRQIAGTEARGDVPPLDVLELRGGIYRDNRWARSAAQPTVVCTTLDQLGSRLLFRGYGVSPGAAPIQAALVAYDSLVLLDEAHISAPFRQSLERVRAYLDPVQWAEEPIGVRPLIFVPMTATPSNVDPNDVIRLDDEDRKNESLVRRLEAVKRASLLRVADVSKAIVEHAGDQAKAGCAAIGIIVNRVATAKEIYHRLREKHPGAVVELVIGAMRPIDRDAQAPRLADLIGPERPPLSTESSFVVATQCLEVGADYDFDVLITECASLDALRQRFGRLNRGGRAIEARAVIVVKDKDVKSEDDPIYGNALAHTWNWLWEHADVEAPPEAGETMGKRPSSKAKAADETRTIDFGIDVFNSLLREHTADGHIPSDLLVPSANAPVMLPAYIDFWCQTSPKPVPDPDVALFIHGPQNRDPDVQVCWRADLVEEKDGLKREHWCDVVALLPPTAAECMSVPISRVRRWLAQTEDALPDLGDVLEVAGQPEDESGNRDRRQKERSLRTSGVLWRGADRSKLLESPNDLLPGDTLVLPVSGEGWKDLGHIPETRPLNEATAEDIDVAETAFQMARGRRVLQLHPCLLASIPSSAEIIALLARIADSEDPPKAGELRNLMNDAAKELSEDDKALRDRLKYFADSKNTFLHEPYPDHRGFVFVARKRIIDPESWFLPSLDDGEDDASRVGRIEPVSLDDHTRHVCDALDRTLNLISSSVSKEAYCVAALRHDWGKADERFQAMLSRTDRTDAWLSVGPSRVLLAKSDRQAQTPSERRAARVRANLPDGYRHEMLSVQLAERAGIPEVLTAQHAMILHLIAAHHGHGRPFAPFVRDDDPPEVELEEVTISPADRSVCPPHRLDSGIADRFWSLTRRYGWWGLAYLEALLRLADQQASADEDDGRYDNEDTPETAEASP